jgi:predicted transcriptional regulator
MRTTPVRGRAGRAGVLAALLLVASFASVQPASARHEGVHVPAARVGDRASYEVSSDLRLGRFTAEWLPGEVRDDRWGDAFPADSLRLLVPAAELLDESPLDTWVEVREAYGPSDLPRWRTSGEETVRRTQTDDYHTPLFVFTGPATAAVTQVENLTTSRSEADPWLRSCFARHTLQDGAPRPGATLPLEQLCPGLSRRVASTPLPARPTAPFLGRNALELRYQVFDAQPSVGDVPLGPGYLSVVVADGLPFLASAEAWRPDGGSAWRYVLAGHAPGDGPPLRAPRQQGDLVASDARQVPGIRTAQLGLDGPADGGSGLPYILDEAVANVRADASLQDFQFWSLRHPEAFLVTANLRLPREGEQTRYAHWTLVFGDRASDGRLETSTVWTRRSWPAAGGLPPAAAAAVPPVDQNGDQGWIDIDHPARAPTGETAMDVASALEAYSVHVPREAGTGALLGFAYDAPTADAPARLRVERAAPGSSAREVLRTVVAMDALTGAALEVAQYHRRSVYGEPLSWDISRPVVQATEHGLEPTGLDAPAVAGLTLVALLLALLAHAGFAAVAYSRLKQSDLLDNPARRKVFDAVAARPGIHLQAILAATGTVRGITVYHLNVLERGGLVAHVSLRKFRRYYVTGTVPFREMRAQAELEAGSARTAYEVVRREPGITLGELAKRLGVTPPAAHKTVERLCDAGLLEKQPEGRTVRIVARGPGPAELN